VDRDGLTDAVVSDGAHAYVLLGQAMPPLGGDEGLVGGVEPVDQ
jgi:hypothetical protein